MSAEGKINRPNTSSRPGKLWKWLAPWLIASAHLLLVGVGIWLALHLIYGDRWWWLFLINTFAVYLLLLPLPLLLALAALTHRRELWAGVGALLLVWIGLYGRLMLPKLPARAHSETTITVMTSNVLGYNEQAEHVLEALLSSDADVIALQELNPAVADVIQRDLSTEYPYQVLNPEEGVTGMGVISRYPITPVDADAALPSHWVGDPQVLDLALDDTTVTLINFHAIPPGNYLPPVLNYTIRQRERQAQALASLAAARSGPAIVLGDLNAVDRSTAYDIMSNSLRDAWRARGWGLGHTFPGAVSEGSSRPVIAGVPVPKWLLRLDYVFHSSDWQTNAAWLGPWDGYSDHRPVMARLALTADTPGTSAAQALRWWPKGSSKP